MTVDCHVSTEAKWSSRLAALRLLDGAEQRQPHPAVLLARERGPVFEEDLNPHADADLVRGDVDHVGHQPGIGLLGELYHRHDVGRFETRNPGLAVDRVSRHDGLPRNGFWCNVGTAATPAGGPRGVEEVAAAGTAGDQ